jgi:excisionase family DNA binding protein
VLQAFLRPVVFSRERAPSRKGGSRVNSARQYVGGVRRIRVNNVARRLGIPPRTVRHLAATRRLPGYKVGAKIWFFDVAEIEAYQARLETRT